MSRPAAGLIALALVACGSRDGKPPATHDAARPGSAIRPPLTLGRDVHELLERFECSRCHDGTGMPTPPTEQHCVQCHREIMAGTFEAAPDDLARWRSNLTSLPVAPSLAAAGRLRRDWLEQFLLHPADLRPHLPATMPRLAITEDEARILAAYLVPEERDHIDLAGADPARGAELFASRGCPSCHAATPPPGAPAPASADAFTLAPDLTRVRDRMQPGWVVAWIVDPSSVSAAATMPRLGVSEPEARDIAAYLWSVEPPALLPPPVEARLPVLARPVGFDEVAERVFLKVCWHCHGAAHYALGDGGPGNTGGFGFTPRGLDLSSYSGIASGSIGADGRRRSIFGPLADGTPRLIAHLMARRAEERGAEVANVRGMPLAMPALSLEDIQLVESWIDQGRPEGEDEEPSPDDSE